MADTLHSQCRGPGFDPWSENYVHMPKLRDYTPQLKKKNPTCRKSQRWKILCVAPETQHSLNQYINIFKTSLVVQWIRILPMQETWVQSLVQEYFTHVGATKPMCHND